jgi:hypothetical protein
MHVGFKICPSLKTSVPLQTVDFHQGRAFVNPFEVMHKDAEPTLQLELKNLNCSDKLEFKFKGGNLLNF